MSDINRENSDLPGEEKGPEQPPETGLITSGRQASVVLRRRGRGAEDLSNAMETANQSLADALRLAFFVLKIAMGVLVAVFVFSGAQKINEGQSGIRLLFGRDVADNLEPGLHLAPPYPIGEMVKVDTGLKTIRIDKAFWPMLTEDNQKLAFEDLIPRSQINPEHDGSLITGDGALAHARLTVSYTRAKPGDWARSMRPEAEESIVRAAARSAMVQVAGQMTLRDLLRSAVSESGSVGGQVARRAQAALDRIESGIKIERVSIEELRPPVAVRDDFAAVQRADSSRAQKIDAAMTYRDETLNKVAGEAAPVLVRAIELYEEALDSDAPAAEQEARLEAVFTLLESRPAQVADGFVEVQIAGEAGRIISQAKQYRTSIESVRRAQWERAEAFTRQHRQNPQLAIERALADASMAFFDRPEVLKLILPRGSSRVTIPVAMDREDIKRRQREENMRKAKEAQDKRDQMIEDDQFDTDTNRIISEG